MIKQGNPNHDFRIDLGMLQALYMMVPIGISSY